MSTAPGRARAPSSRPTWSAIAVAVAAWSPVIIFTAMPAVWQAATAAVAAARGGSSMACSPVRTRPSGQRVLAERRPSDPGRGRPHGGGQHPQPLAGQVVGRAAAPRRGPAARTAPSASICAPHSSSIRSTAPLTSTTSRVGGRRWLAVQGGHVLAFGAERDRRQAGKQSVDPVAVEPGLGGGHQHRAPRWGHRRCPTARRARVRAASLQAAPASSDQRSAWSASSGRPARPRRRAGSPSGA